MNTCDKKFLFCKIYNFRVKMLNKVMALLDKGDRFKIEFREKKYLKN